MQDDAAPRPPSLRRLGLIGGLGVGATVYYYKALVRAHAERALTPDLVIAHAHLGVVLDHVRSGSTDSLEAVAEFQLLDATRARINAIMKKLAP